MKNEQPRSFSREKEGKKNSRKRRKEREVREESWMSLRVRRSLLGWMWPRLASGTAHFSELTGFLSSAQTDSKAHVAPTRTPSSMLLILVDTPCFCHIHYKQTNNNNASFVMATELKSCSSLLTSNTHKVLRQISPTQPRNISETPAVCVDLWSGIKVNPAREFTAHIYFTKSVYQDIFLHLDWMKLAKSNQLHHHSVFNSV